MSRGSNIATCGPGEHPCKGCGLPTDERLELCNLCEEERARAGFQFFSCGGTCDDGEDHVWEGPTRYWEDEMGAVTESVTCSKCGLAKIDWDMMNAP